MVNLAKPRQFDNLLLIIDYKPRLISPGNKISNIALISSTPSAEGLTSLEKRLFSIGADVVKYNKKLYKKTFDHVEHISNNIYRSLGYDAMPD